MGIIERFAKTAAVDSAPVNLSRRRVLQGAGGLVLGVYLSPFESAQATAQQAPGEYAANAFVRIGSDNRVTVIAKHLEMGQGTYTGLATLLAEELDADWSQVQVEGAPADAKRYGNTLLGGIQGTGGSNAMANAHEQMRRAGASARAMLVSAAAQRWQVDPAQISVSNGVVQHAASRRKASFGELAEAAAQQPVPAQVRLKEPSQFKLIGKQKLSRRDSHDKTDGSARFTQDVQLPGMLVAVVAHPPRFGARLKSFDDAAAKAIKGVVDVVRFEGDAKRFSGVAVLAHNTWIARQGRDALKLEWDESAAMSVGSAELMAQYRSLADQAGTVARQEGDAAAALAQAVKTVQADYEFPYLSHAAMEPLNCVVHIQEDGCQIYNGEQFQTFDQAGVARLLNLPPEKVQITQLYAGGSFGRRANPNGDYVLEAAEIARNAAAQGHRVPIKMVWTREEDTRAGYYRPLFLHRVRAGLDAQNRILAWQQRAVGQSIMSGTPLAGLVKNGIDGASVEGILAAYAAANVQVELHSPVNGVPVQWWRSVGHTHTAFATESMIDELAAAAGQDPYQFRRGLLAQSPRHLGVLDLAAQKAGWGKPLKAGAGVKRGRGIAVHESFNSFVAQVVEVSLKNGQLKVDRVVCAVDCGLAINPDVIHAQMEGGIGFALTAALYSAITVDKGAVQQRNFDGYPMLRMNEMPKVEVHIVPSAAPPTGVGEPGVPPLAPALANAIFAASGQRIRKLPIASQLST
ncbi:isoquinoline 1-oxidoreductase, beta subunit [Solimonas aquatica]|uniref:Isoquinoline 1-oxidoreductase, beta subunit n=1 Tax=Solimonas aquatica TaxID=489703 RepID=A0A1H9JAG8_9GAMM|nr:xanthine dehydrogenase family protein molybdopterin-binding subunit [Solimonas aquatica]SEQ83778.1 isoquinoline 1-oxidoreductase, beta subunit [Solimonas aquatica]